MLGGWASVGVLAGECGVRPQVHLHLRRRRGSSLLLDVFQSVSDRFNGFRSTLEFMACHGVFRRLNETF